MEYAELLKHPFWQRKRLEILQRDDFKCRHCNDRLSTLHIHHLFYNMGCLPWEYPDEVLITLCDLCHLKEEFFKWVNAFGVRGLVYQGFIRQDVEDVKELVFRKVLANHNRETSIRYMEQIKSLMSNG